MSRFFNIFAFMAIINQPLTEGQILGFKGTVDFYYFRGKVVAREWPRRRKIPPKPAEAANQTFFGRVQTKIKNMSEPNRDEWRKFVRGTNIVWTDAIRFFNLSDNPARTLCPNLYLKTAAFRYDLSEDRYFMFFSFVIDGPPVEPGMNVIYQTSNTPFQNVVWQAVGQKRRRRAILSEQFRPQFTGFLKSKPLEMNPFTNRYYLEQTVDTTFEWIRFAVVPADRPIPSRLQTPIYVQKADWLPF